MTSIKSVMHFSTYVEKSCQSTFFLRHFTATVGWVQNLDTSTEVNDDRQMVRTSVFVTMWQTVLGQDYYYYYYYYYYYKMYW